MRTITVLGSTGSIGTQTLEVARWRGWRVAALAAGRNVDLLAAQAETFRPDVVACDPAVAGALRSRLPRGTQLDAEPGAAERVARRPADSVVAAIPGMAGLAPVRAALQEGRHVALATKEAMVVAGPLVWGEARRHGGRITPVDSEHAGLDQLLRGEDPAAVSALVLTASGGPFRGEPADLRSVTPAQALTHPTWSMGAKVTIDSATLFNKGLEVLEAHHLFGVPLGRIEVVVHPQSLVHAMVRFRDGSILAQAGPHDMRLPILWALEGAARPPAPVAPLALNGAWTFEAPDHVRFPALGLAYEAGRLGGTAPAVLNAADEIAVEAFLDGRITFPDIAEVLRVTLEAVPPAALAWDALHEADASARRVADEAVDVRAARV